jgi:hypothetical protein
MDSDEGFLPQNELFDESVLLKSVDGDHGDAKALLDASIYETHRLLEKMSKDIALNRLQEVVTDAANIHGFAVAMASKTIGHTAERIARMAISHNMDEVIVSFKDLQSCLKQLDLHLRCSGWH